MKPIAWSARACRHMLAIHGYISKFNPRAARSTAEQILESINMVAEHPQIGRAGRDSRTREFPVPGTPYLIVYTLRDMVEIVAILHGAQLIAK